MQAAGSSWRMAGGKGAQGRKAPGAVPMGVSKQATTEVGVQWMVK